jgi:hypothetical protein
MQSPDGRENRLLKKQATCLKLKQIPGPFA